MSIYKYGDLRGVHGAAAETGIFIESFNYNVTDTSYTGMDNLGEINRATHLSQVGTFSFEGAKQVDAQPGAVSTHINLANAMPALFGTDVPVTAVINNAANSGSNTAEQKLSVSGNLYPFAPPTPDPPSGAETQAIENPEAEPIDPEGYAG